MGKSTTARMFACEGLPVWDADAAVRTLYQRGGAGVALIRGLAPAAIVDDEVDRARLRQAIAADRELLGRIEAAIHPLVAGDRQNFLAGHADAKAVVFDIPLLFETGAEQWLDAVAVVTAPLEVQRERVMQRGTMTRQEFEDILARQMPDAEKRHRADFIIRTDQGLDAARARVRGIIIEIEARQRRRQNA